MSRDFLRYINASAVFTFLLLAISTSFPVSAEEPIREFVDRTGKHKIQARFVQLSEDTVVLETENGRTIKLLLAKLSSDDQTYIRKIESDSEEPANKPPMKSGDHVVARGNAGELAAKVKTILTDACYSCHGQDGSNEGGFNFVLHVQRMTDGDSYIAAGEPDDSYLMERVDDGDMPPPGEGRELTKDDVATLKAWIAAGAPDFDQQSEVTVITPQQIESTILSDVEQFESRDRSYQRYFTLVHLYNAGTSQDELETYRKAFTKLINSLSWNGSIVIPETINDSKTIMRLDLRKVSWSPEIWDHVLSGYPYGWLSDESKTKEFESATQTKLPFVRADWFVSVASRPPLYHTLLQIPETDFELEKLLRIDVANNIASDQVIRAGFNRSGVSQNNRMIERHETPYGSYWKSYDFAGSSDRQNLFNHPLGPGDKDSFFAHDGGEMIFTLPNGLNGYMLTTADGNRLDVGPTSIVSDPGRLDKTVVNGVSCMSCHYAGMIEKQDEIRPVVEKLRNAYPEAEDILAQYPGTFAMQLAYREDASRFAVAMQKIGITRMTKSGEPVSNMARRFETELDLNLACAEMGIEQDAFPDYLQTSPELARSLGSLTQPGGTIKRDAFVQIFLKAIVKFELGIAVGPTGDNPFASNGSSSIASSNQKRSTDPGEFAAIIAKLKGRWNEQSEGLNALKLSPPKTPNDALSDSVIGIVENGNSITQQEALKVLVLIDPARSKQVLLETIKTTDQGGVFVRRAAFNALAKLKDPETVDAIAVHLDGRHNSDATKALVAIGEPSEDALLDFLKTSADSWTKSRPIIEALGAVGTKKSRAVLGKLSRSRHRFLADDSKSAIRRIDARLKEKE